MPNNFHLNPIEGMTWITDLCGMQIMSSTRMPYDIALPLICWKPAPTCAPFRSCSAIETWKRQRFICISHNAISTLPPARWMLLPWMHKED
jgi:hypothetical protein